MIKSIIALPKKFDTRKIMSCFGNLSSIEGFEELNQLAIMHSTKSDSLFDGCGSLYDFKLRMFTNKTSDFTILNKMFVGTYIETVVDEVNKQAIIDGVNIGRVRILQLNPKTCYSLHQDPEEFRYHIPLITNDKCFFVNNDIIERMPMIGTLYKFRTKEMHTAVNASFEKRIHLVFDTY